MGGGGGMSLWTGVAYIVGVIIGSGIYSSPGYILGSVGSPGAALVVWGLGGVVGYLGAMSYVELGVAFKDRPGGDVVYLQEQYGAAMGFVYTASQILVARPASLGMICAVFGENINAAMGVDGGSGALLLKLPAVLGLVSLCGLNVASVKASAAVQRCLTSGKVATLAVLAACAVPVFFNPSLVDRDEPVSLGVANTSESVGDWGEAFMNSLWAYDGWANVAFLTTELRSAKDVERCIVIGLPICIGLYLCANLAYLVVLDAAVVSGTNHVAVSYFTALFRDGGAGGAVASVVVAMSTFGSANGSIYTAGAMTSGAAQAGLCSAGLRNYTVAVVFECALALAYLLAADFSSLLVGFGVTRYFFCGLVIAGVWILRRQPPPPCGDGAAPPNHTAAAASTDADGAYRVPLLYTVVFGVFAAMLVVAPVAKRPVATLLAFSSLLAPVPVYYAIPPLRRRFGGAGGCWAALLPVGAPAVSTRGADFEVLSPHDGADGASEEFSDASTWSDNGDPNQC